MGLVSFEQIKPIMPDEATGMVSGDILPLDATVNHPERPNLYDPLWGYFVFGQSVACEYGDGETYLDRAVFTINGTFTANAEQGKGPVLTDAQAFSKLVAKYEALKTFLDATRLAGVPTNYDDFGTAADGRVVALPSPLKDKDGKTVYAFPESLEISQTQFPIKIQYMVTLMEAKFPHAKLVLNNHLLDGGVVEFTPPKPILIPHRLVGAAGAIFQLRNYTPAGIGVTGTMPLPGRNGEPYLTNDLQDLYDSLSKGGMDVAVAYRASGTIPSGLYTNMTVDEDPRIELQTLERIASVSVRGRT